MARGDRREPVVLDYEDCRTFVSNSAEACRRLKIDEAKSSPGSPGDDEKAATP